MTIRDIITSDSQLFPDQNLPRELAFKPSTAPTRTPGQSSTGDPSVSTSAATAADVPECPWIDMLAYCALRSSAQSPSSAVSPTFSMTARDKPKTLQQQHQHRYQRSSANPSVDTQPLHRPEVGGAGVGRGGAQEVETGAEIRETLLREVLESDQKSSRQGTQSSFLPSTSQGHDIRNATVSMKDGNGEAGPVRTETQTVNTSSQYGSSSQPHVNSVSIESRVVGSSDEALTPSASTPSASTTGHSSTTRSSTDAADNSSADRRRSVSSVASHTPRRRSGSTYLAGKSKSSDSGSPNSIRQTPSTPKPTVRSASRSQGRASVSPAYRQSASPGTSVRTRASSATPSTPGSTRRTRRNIASTILNDENLTSEQWINRVTAGYSRSSPTNSPTVFTPGWMGTPRGRHGSALAATEGGTGSADRLLLLERVVHYEGGSALLLYGGKMLVVASGPLLLLLDINGTSDKLCRSQPPGLWRAFLPDLTPPSSSPSSLSQQDTADSYPRLGGDGTRETEGISQVSLRGHSQPVTLLHVSPEHRWMVSCDSPKSSQGPGASQGGEGRGSPLLILWDLEQGRRAASFRPHGESVLCCEFNSDGSRLATVGTDLIVGKGSHRTLQTLIKLWDIVDLLQASAPSPIPLARQTCDFPTVALCFLPQPDRYGATNLVTCGRENIRFWRLRTTGSSGYSANGSAGGTRSSLQSRQEPGSLVLSGRPVLLSEFCRGFLFTALTFVEVPIALTLTGRRVSQTVQAVDAFSSLITYVLAVSTKGVLLKIDYLAEEVVGSYQLHSAAIRSITVHDTSGFVVTGGEDGLLRVWPADLTFSDFLLEARHEGAVSTLHLAMGAGREWERAGAGDRDTTSASSLVLAVGTSCGTLGLLDLSCHRWHPAPTKYPYRTVLRSHTGPITSLASRPPLHEEIATLGTDGTIRLWDTSDGSQSFEFQSPTDTPLVTAFQPVMSAHQLVVGFSSGYIRVFDVDTTTTLVERQLHRQVPVCGLVFVHTGNRLFVLSRNGQISVLDNCLLSPSQQTVHSFELIKTIVAEVGIGADADFHVALDTTGLMLAYCGQTSATPMTVVDTVSLSVLLRGHMAVTKPTNRINSSRGGNSIGGYGGFQMVSRMKPNTVSPSHNDNSQGTSTMNSSSRIVGMSFLESSEGALALLLLTDQHLVCLSINSTHNVQGPGDIEPDGVLGGGIERLDGVRWRLSWGGVSYKKLDFPSPYHLYRDHATGLVYIPYLDSVTPRQKKRPADPLRNENMAYDSPALAVLKITLETSFPITTGSSQLLPTPTSGSRKAATATASGAVSVIAVSTVQAYIGLPGKITDMSVCPGSGRIVMADEIGAITVWKLYTDRARALPTVDLRSVRSNRKTDNRYVKSGGEGGGLVDRGEEVEGDLQMAIDMEDLGTDVRYISNVPTNANLNVLGEIEPEGTTQNQMQMLYQDSFEPSNYETAPKRNSFSNGSDGLEVGYSGFGANANGLTDLRASLLHLSREFETTLQNLQDWDLIPHSEPQVGDQVQVERGDEEINPVQYPEELEVVNKWQQALSGAESVDSFIRDSDVFDTVPHRGYDIAGEEEGYGNFVAEEDQGDYAVVDVPLVPISVRVERKSNLKSYGHRLSEAEDEVEFDDELEVEDTSESAHPDWRPDERAVREGESAGENEGNSAEEEEKSDGGKLGASQIGIYANFSKSKWVMLGEDVEESFEGNMGDGDAEDLLESLQYGTSRSQAIKNITSQQYSILSNDVSRASHMNSYTMGLAREDVEIQALIDEYRTQLYGSGHGPHQSTQERITSETWSGSTSRLHPHPATNGDSDSAGQPSMLRSLEGAERVGARSTLGAASLPADALVYTDLSHEEAEDLSVSIEDVYGEEDDGEEQAVPDGAQTARIEIGCISSVLRGPPILCESAPTMVTTDGTAVYVKDFSSNSGDGNPRNHHQQILFVPEPKANTAGAMEVYQLSIDPYGKHIACVMRRSSHLTDAISPDHTRFELVFWSRYTPSRYAPDGHMWRLDGEEWVLAGGETAIGRKVRQGLVQGSGREPLVVSWCNPNGASSLSLLVAAPLASSENCLVLSLMNGFSGSYDGGYSDGYNGADLPKNEDIQSVLLEMPEGMAARGNTFRLSDEKDPRKRMQLKILSTDSQCDNCSGGRSGNGILLLLYSSVEMLVVKAVFGNGNDNSSHCNLLWRWDEMSMSPVGSVSQLLDVVHTFAPYPSSHRAVRTTQTNGRESGNGYGHRYCPSCRQREGEKGGRLGEEVTVVPLLFSLHSNHTLQAHVMAPSEDVEEESPESEALDVRVATVRLSKITALIQSLKAQSIAVSAEVEAPCRWMILGNTRTAHLFSVEMEAPKGEHPLFQSSESILHIVLTPIQQVSVKHPLHSVVFMPRLQALRTLLPDYILCSDRGDIRYVPNEDQIADQSHPDLPISSPPPSLQQLAPKGKTVVVPDVVVAASAGIFAVLSSLGDIGFHDLSTGVLIQCGFDTARTSALTPSRHNANKSIEPVVCITASEDTFAIGSLSGRVTVVSAASLSTVTTTVATPHLAPIQQLLFVCGGDGLAVLCKDGSVTYLDASLQVSKNRPIRINPPRQTGQDTRKSAVTWRLFGCSGEPNLWAVCDSTGCMALYGVRVAGLAVLHSDTGASVESISKVFRVHLRNVTDISQGYLMRNGSDLWIAATAHSSQQMLGGNISGFFTFTWNSNPDPVDVNMKPLHILDHFNDPTSSPTYCTFGGGYCISQIKHSLQCINLKQLFQVEEADEADQILSLPEHTASTVPLPHGTYHPPKEPHLTACLYSTRASDGGSRGRRGEEGGETGDSTLMALVIRGDPAAIFSLRIE